jgi:hypothetical protein
MAVTGAIWKLFERIDKVVSSDVRQATARWLSGAGSNSFFISSFGAAFDAVFGPRPLSWKCISRATVASVAFTAALFSLWAGLRPDELQVQIDGEVGGLPDYITAAVSTTVVICALPAYISLLKTRYLVRLAERFRIAIWAGITDVALSAVLGIIPIATMMYFNRNVVTYVGTDELSAWKSEIAALPYYILTVHSWDDSLQGSPDTPIGMWPGVYYFSTFLPSTAVWVYGLASVFIKARPNLHGKGLIGRLLNVEGQPFMSLGTVAIAIVSAVYSASFITQAVVTWLAP